MKLPSLSQPERYRGLYIFDFGEWTAVGYTAEEIAILLDSEVYKGGKVYKIHRASPDGRLEIRGISGVRFNTECGLFFYRDAGDDARRDFEELNAIADDTPPPSRAFVQLADRGSQVDRGRYVTALIYPAEFDDDVCRWLIECGFVGGDTVEGGVSHVSNYYGEQKTLLDRRQLWSSSVPSRSADEVLATVRLAVQR
ncbi:hypothetical protein RAS1_19830 [Phycisphaerae bacterium RAS1]|nr:hypothetical protein RAS1_19830 [Phycisphaerae bacterium RAS1]